LPYELYERHALRRYGFHGTSHGFVARGAADRLGRPLDTLQLVTAHLGNGSSTCAIRHGKSVDTSMGLTPLEGLMMGTRSGDVDPSVFEFLADHTGSTMEQTTDLLSRKSGLLGVSGVSNDMRSVLQSEERGHERARLAVALFCRRLAKSILAMCAGLDQLDALVFTGGIGENAARVRTLTLERLALLGFLVDPALNAEHGTRSAGRITAMESKIPALVVPTNEELVIAREALACLNTRPSDPR
jgi:acetate kinase